MERMLDYGLAGGVILLFSLTAWWGLRAVGSFFKDLIDPAGNGGKGGVLYRVLISHLELIDRLSGLQESINNRMGVHIEESRKAFTSVENSREGVRRMVGGGLAACDLVESLCRRGKLWDKEIERALERVRYFLRQNGDFSIQGEGFGCTDKV